MYKLNWIRFSSPQIQAGKHSISNGYSNFTADKGLDITARRQTNTRGAVGNF